MALFVTLVNKQLKVHRTLGDNIIIGDIDATITCSVKEAEKLYQELEVVLFHGRDREPTTS